MVKKSSSSSNVPHQPTNSCGPKSKQPSPQKNNSSATTHNGPNNNTVLNSKLLHNQSHQQKTKKPRDNENSSVSSNNNTSDLMKKLSEALQKQQNEKDGNSTTSANNASEKKRTRKGSVPTGSMQNNTTYAGAAFDRAPAATSFPIPSFIKSTIPATSSPPSSSNSLSQSCPLPSSVESSTASLKSLSISELFPTEQNIEKKKLDNLTQDLRKLLNLK